MKTILLFIYHYAHMSDLLQTEWIREVSKDIRVIVITPKRQDEKPIPHFQSPNVMYKNYSVKIPVFSTYLNYFGFLPFENTIL